MDTISIKEELKQLIDMENDPVLLQAIKELLNPPPMDPLLREKLISRSQKAIDDYKAGRVYTHEDVTQSLNRIIGK